MLEMEIEIRTGKKIEIIIKTKIKSGFKLIVKIEVVIIIRKRGGRDKDNMKRRNRSRSR